MTEDAGALALRPSAHAGPFGAVAGGRRSSGAEQSEFEHWVREYRKELYRFAFWLTRDPTVAEDAVQEALLRGWQSWNRLRDRTAVKRWFLTIVRRECARAYERRRHEMTNIDDLTAAEQHLIAVVEDAATRDVQYAILRLDETYREPLVMQVLMGYSTAEIAVIMGITQGAVLTRLCRARQQLAKYVASDD